MPQKDFLLCKSLMGEGFILLTRGYGFMGGVLPPFWHVNGLQVNGGGV